MKMKKTRPLRLLFLLALLPLLAGCWGNHPLNERAIVLGLGISPGPRGEETYTFVFPTAVAPATPSGGTSTNLSQSLYVTSTTAATLGQAVAAVQPSLSRFLYLGQLTLIVLSDRLAPTQTRNVLTDLNNMNDLDQTSLLATAPSVRPVVGFSHVLEVPPVYYPARMLTCYSCQPADLQMPFWKFFARLHTPGATAWLPFLRVTHNRLSIGGVALYRHYRFAGVLSGPALDGFVYGNGLEERGSIAVPLGGRLVSLSNIAASCRKHFLAVAGGVPAFTLDITATGMADSLSPFAPALSRLAGAAVRRKVEATLVAARRMGVDPFSLGADLAWADPPLFTRLGDWEKVFPRARIRVRVDLNYYSPPGLRLSSKL